MVKSLIDLKHIWVTDIMIPREKIFSLSINDTLSSKIISHIATKNYSKIPVFDLTSNLIGFVNVKTIINLKNKPIKNLNLEKPLLINASISLFDLLHIF